MKPGTAVSEKPWWRVVSLRALLALAILGFAGCAIGARLTWSVPLNPISPALATAAGVNFFLLLFLLYDLRWFPLNYTRLGRYQRSDPPPEWKPTRTRWRLLRPSSRLLGRGHMAVCKFGPGGFQFRPSFCGWAFISSKEILCLRKDCCGWHMIEHSSPEVRSPLFVDPQGTAEIRSIVFQLLATESPAKN
jgi:hypothetical protein